MNVWVVSLINGHIVGVYTTEKKALAAQEVTQRSTTAKVSMTIVGVNNGTYFPNAG